MTDKKSKTTKMVYTTDHHIALGEAIIMENGEYAIRVKKPKGHEIETVTIGKLVSQIVQVATANT